MAAALSAPPPLPGTLPGLCRDCCVPTPCPCGGGRVVSHPDLFALAIAHLDCDAFFASVEKRDRPDLADRPVVVGGGTRGVVTAACYVARLSGVKSAMPMFKALKLCPDAVVIRPDFEKYVAAAKAIRALMLDVTPAVQPLSIDEAALDLSGTDLLHRASPAEVLAALALRIERQVGVTVSIGLAPNRLLAKIAAGRDKPRGFAVLGRDAAAILAPQPVGLLPGIGPVAVRRLAALGLTTLGQLQRLSDADARKRLGAEGPSLAARARGEDFRAIDPARSEKSIGAETTFAEDAIGAPEVERHLWRCCEKLARRLRDQDLAAAGITLKLKTAAFATRTRAARLPAPTALPDILFTQGRALLARELDGTAFRLVGLTAAPLAPAHLADLGDLADRSAPRIAAAQRAIDALRGRYGPGIVGKGRVF